MGRFIVITLPKAEEHLKEYKKSGNKVILNRIKRILKELEEHPETGIGRPEKLKYGYSGQWSREIDKKNRMIYQIYETSIVVEIISAKGHYDDH